MLCHSCQTEVPLKGGESVGFRDVCDRCRTDLHICLNCAHYDLTAYNGCRESSAERILDPDRANRCEYFKPGQRASDENEARTESMSDLEKLFKAD